MRMPWQELLPMDQRIHLVTEYQSGRFTMTELAEQYGISRKTGYKWVGRCEGAGYAGLADRQRRPHESPQATDAARRASLMRLRPRHPRWGPRKRRVGAARRAPKAAWPCPSTVSAHLKARGLITARRRRRPPGAVASTRPPITSANEVWTTDFKGEFRTGDGHYCYPLTLRDGFSRFVLRCDGLPTHTLAATRPRFARAFAEYGLPERLRSDNGPPFGGPRLGRLSSVAVWGIPRGTLPDSIQPGPPGRKRSHPPLPPR